MAAKTPPWKRKNPAKKHTKLTPASKAKARAAARRAGRTYPSLVDNMNAAKAQKKRPTKKAAKRPTKKPTTKKAPAKKRKKAS